MYIYKDILLLYTYCVRHTVYTNQPNIVREMLLIRSLLKGTVRRSIAPAVS